MDANSLVMLFVWIVVVGLIFYVAWWGLGQLALPEPFDKLARGVIIVIAVLLLINVLLGLTGSAPFRLRG